MGTIFGFGLIPIKNDFGYFCRNKSNSAKQTQLNVSLKHKQKTATKISTVIKHLCSYAQAAVAFTLAPKSAKVNKAPFLPRKILSSVTAFACSAEISHCRSSLMLMFRVVPFKTTVSHNHSFSTSKW